MEKIWLEMPDLIKKDYDKSVWIPLLSYQVLKKEMDFGQDGHIEEFFSAVAIIFPENKKGLALEIKWTDVTLGRDNRPYVDDNQYKEAGFFEHYANKVEGKYLVLQQHFNYGEEKPQWHLYQDLVLALGLWRKNDSWLSPSENYLEIVRLKRNDEGKPICIEIRAEHLKDYLAARKSGILLSRFHSRRVIIEDWNKIGWIENYHQTETKDQYQWEGRCSSIHEGSGYPYGSQTAFFHIGRTNVNYEEDVPTYGFPSDDNVSSESKTISHKGRKLYFMSGELWKTDWIMPGTKSPRVKGDKIESKIPFIVNTDGSTLCSDELIDSGKYLWFKPTIVQAILGYPKAILGWYTEDTGQLGLVGRAVAFGVNSEGLINVYAKDIALLPEDDKKIWVAHNVSPEGGVSKELLQSQMEAKPAATQAPEVILAYMMKRMDQIANKIFGANLFVSHDKAEEIQRKIHRFQAVTLDGVCLLAKEMTRFIIERLNYDLLKSITPSLEKDTRSLKRLEKILCDKSLKGRELLAPLAGIYELRKLDAHLSSDDFYASLELLKIDKNNPPLMMGKSMISKIAEHLYIISELLLKQTPSQK